jgi:protoporphyrinogen oxidase
LTPDPRKDTLRAVTYDAIILGAGPAGLGAGLALARDGQRVAVVEAGSEVGGLCRTLRRGELSYDLGGHILFVHDQARRDWLTGLLGDDAIWVDRPVVCRRDDVLTAGRYLDQRPDGPIRPGVGPSAATFLAGSFGRRFVDTVMRRYLEKVDGMPLERIPAARALKLMVEQAAPAGFWYAAGGIGQLMEAMAAEIRRRGSEVFVHTRVERIRTDAGRAVGIDATSSHGPWSADAAGIIAGLPPTLVAKLVDPSPPAGIVPTLTPRAAALVYLLVDKELLTEHAWVQIDSPRVPFARMFETKNWSARLVPPGRTVIGCECYYAPDASDAAWSLDDEALGAACARALVDPLGLVEDQSLIRPLEVIRLPRAWSLVEADAIEAAGAPLRWVGEIDGLRVAQGGDVVLAIAAGEQAAAS